MRLATVRLGTRSHVARIDGEFAVLLAFDTLEDLIGTPGWEELAARDDGTVIAANELVFGPLVSRPAKILCVGLNYRAHIRELGRPTPEYPTLFAKFANSLIGPHDDIPLPPESDQVDWEAELAIVIGQPCRRSTPEAATDAIAGYTVLNDVSMRDWQWRTTQWLQGKSFERSTPIGPVLVTRDEFTPHPDLELTCEINGELVQSARTSDLLFGPAEIVSYISQFTTLMPGDVIATGTPGGVGVARDPKRFLQAGDVVTTSISGIGACLNTCVPEVA